MRIRIPSAVLEEIRQHGRRAYPQECCGALLGIVNGDGKLVRKAVALANLRAQPDKAQRILSVARPAEETARNRFLIDPEEQIQVERQARAEGLEVLGYYHSHPDHPARPSNYDREHAWPWYSYIIAAVERGEPGELSSWVLNDDRSEFHPEELQVLNLRGGLST